MSDGMYMQEFWSRQHRMKNPYWLTGWLPEDVLSLHGITTPVNKRVMDIGVGFGLMTRFLTQCKNEVVAVDVCEEALQTARENGAASAILTCDLASADPVDIAICHNLLHHVPDEVVTFLLDTIRLRPDGILSIQQLTVRQSHPELESAVGLCFIRSMDDVLALTKKNAISVSGEYARFKEAA